MYFLNFLKEVFVITLITSSIFFSLVYGVVFLAQVVR